MAAEGNSPELAAAGTTVTSDGQEDAASLVEQALVPEFDDGLFDSMLNTIMGPSDGVFGQLDEKDNGSAVPKSEKSAGSSASNTQDSVSANVQHQSILHELNQPSAVDWCLRARLRFVSSLGFRCLMQALCQPTAEPARPAAPEDPNKGPLHSHGLLSSLAQGTGSTARLQSLFRECLEQRSSDFIVDGSTAPRFRVHPAHRLLQRVYQHAQLDARTALHQHRFPTDALPRTFLSEASTAADACCSGMHITPQYTHKASISSHLPTLHVPASRQSEAAHLLLVRRMRFVLGLCSAVGGLIRDKGGQDVAVLYADGNYVHFRRVRTAGGGSCVFATLASSTPGCRKALRQRNIQFRTPFDHDLETEHIHVDADAVAELVRLNRDTGISVRHTSGARSKARGAAAMRNHSAAALEEDVPTEGGSSEQASLVASVGHSVSLSRSMAHKLNGQGDLGGVGMQAGGGQLAGSTSFSVASALIVTGVHSCCQLVAALGEDALQGGAGALSQSARRWVWGAALGAGAHGTPIPGVDGANVSCGLHTIGNDVPSIVASVPFEQCQPEQLRVVDRGALRVPVLKDDGSTDSSAFTTVYALDVTGPILPQVARRALQAVARMQALLTVSHQCFRVCVPRVMRNVELVPPPGLKVLAAAVPSLSACLRRLLQTPPEADVETAPQRGGATSATEASKQEAPDAVAHEVLTLLEAVRVALGAAAAGGLIQATQAKSSQGKAAASAQGVNRKLLSAQYRSVVDSLAAQIPKSALEGGAPALQGGLVATTRSLVPVGPSVRPGEADAQDAHGNTSSVFGEDVGDAAGDRIMALTSGIGGVRATSSSNSGGGGGNMSAAAARGSYNSMGRVSMATSRTIKAAPAPRATARQTGRKRDRHTAAAAGRRGVGKAPRGGGRDSPQGGGLPGAPDTGDAPSTALAVGRHSHFHSDHGAVRCRLETHPLASLQSSPMFRRAVLREMQAQQAAGGALHFDPPVEHLKEVRFSLLRSASVPGGGGAVKPGGEGGQGTAWGAPPPTPPSEAQPTILDTVWHAAENLFASPAGADEETTVAQGGAGGLLAGLPLGRVAEPQAAAQGMSEADESTLLCAAILPLLLPVGSGAQQGGEGGGAAGMSPLRAWCVAVRCAWAASSSIHATPASQHMLRLLQEHFPAAASVLASSPVAGLVPKRSQAQLRPTAPLPQELQAHTWLLGDACPPYTLSDGVAQEVACAAMGGVTLARAPAVAAAGYAAVRVLNATALMAERVQYG